MVTSIFAVSNKPLFPDKLEYTYALVKHYADNDQVDKAISNLQALVDSHADNMQPKLVMLDLLMQKKPELIDKSLADYLARFPEEPELYFRLTALKLKDNKLPEAKQALNKIVELKSEGKEGIKAKVMLAKLAVQENDSETAQAMLTSVLTTDARNLDALMLKARLDLDKGLYDDVITSMRVVTQDYSSSDDALVLLGQAFLKKNSPELAEENFRKALALNPANFEALIPVASKLIKNKEAKRAEELLTKALEAKPDHPAALQALAQVRMLQKDWEGTQKVADMIGSKPKGAGFSKFIGGKISEEQGLYKEAIGQYKEALATAPDLQDALRGMATSYEALNDRKSMITFLDGFIAAHPEDSYPWLLKGQLLASDKRLDDALKVLTEAIGKWPKTADFYEAAVNVHLEKKATDQALATINKGLEAVPGQLNLSIQLASIHEQSGDFAKALEVCL